MSNIPPPSRSGAGTFWTSSVVKGFEGVRAVGLESKGEMVR
jgi:hypothetical protein